MYVHPHTHTYCDCCGNIISKKHGKVVKGGILRKVALLGWSIQQICSDVVPTAASANLVLGTPVPGNPTMVKPLIEMVLQLENQAKEAAVHVTVAMAIATAVMATAATMMATATAAAI
jgi:hypothetical protein